VPRNERKLPGFGAVGRAQNIPYVLLGIALLLFPISTRTDPQIDVAAFAGLGAARPRPQHRLATRGCSTWAMRRSSPSALFVPSLASGQFNIHISFWILLSPRPSSPPSSACCSAAPTLAYARLSRDRDPRFREIVPRVFRNAQCFTGGVNGIVGVDQPKLRRFWLERATSLQPIPYYYLILGVIHPLPSS